MRKQIKKPATAGYATLLENYHEHTGIVGYSENGRKIKYANTAEFLVWLESREITSIREVEPFLIKEHYRYMKNRPHKKYEGIFEFKNHCRPHAEHPGIFCLAPGKLHYYHQSHEHLKVQLSGTKQETKDRFNHQ